MMTDKCTSPEGHTYQYAEYKDGAYIITEDGNPLSGPVVVSLLRGSPSMNLLDEHASLTEKVERLVTGGKKFSASIHYDNSPDDGYAIVDPQDWAEFAALLESEG